MIPVEVFYSISAEIDELCLMIREVSFAHGIHSRKKFVAICMPSRRQIIGSISRITHPLI